MRRILFAAALAFCGGLFAASLGGQQQPLLTTGDELPALCSAGSAFVKTGSAPGFYVCVTNGPNTTWSAVATALGGVSGFAARTIVMTDETTCPDGTAEEPAFDGRSPVGVSGVGTDAGTDTGGAATVTPAGTVAALTFTGTSNQATSTITAGTPAGTVSTPTIAWPAGVPTFAGTLTTTIVNHVHTLATGTTATGNFSQVIGTVDTTSGGTGGTPTQTALGTLSGNPTAGGAANYTPAGTVAWPAGVPTSTTPTFTGSALSVHGHTLTPAGTINTPGFTGTQFDNRPPLRTVRFCKSTS